jgi:hypothetical protein
VATAFPDAGETDDEDDQEDEDDEDVGVAAADVAVRAAAVALLCDEDGRTTAIAAAATALAAPAPAVTTASRRLPRRRIRFALVRSPPLSGVIVTLRSASSVAVAPACPTRIRACCPHLQRFF